MSLSPSTPRFFDLSPPPYVEGLANLDAAPDTFTFAGFSLNFRGRDGSPLRAVAICHP